MMKKIYQGKNLILILFYMLLTANLSSADLTNETCLGCHSANDLKREKERNCPLFR